MEIKDLPFSGVICDKEKNICKVWWLATIKYKTITVQAEIPIEILTNRDERNKEIMIQNLLKDSKVDIEGLEI